MVGSYPSTCAFLLSLPFHKLIQIMNGCKKVPVLIVIADDDDEDNRNQQIGKCGEGKNKSGQSTVEITCFGR